MGLEFPFRYIHDADVHIEYSFDEKTGTINYMAPEAITFINDAQRDPYLKV